MSEKYNKVYERLKKQQERVTWDALEDHYKRGAVFLVSPELDLTEIGSKIAVDDVDAVRKWMKDEQVRKPIGDEIITFQNDDSLEFDFIIVQPYVLIQEYIDL